MVTLDVAESSCAGDESAAGDAQRKQSVARDGADFLGQSVGAAELDAPLNAAQFGFLVAALGHMLTDIALDLLDERASA